MIENRVYGSFETSARSTHSPQISRCSSSAASSGSIGNHAQVVALKISVGKVLHGGIVTKWLEYLNFFLRGGWVSTVGGAPEYL